MSVPLNHCEPGNVVWAVKLHLDEAREVEVSRVTGRGKSVVFEVGGKERLMLVISRQTAHGTRPVLSFTRVQPQATDCDDYFCDSTGRPKVFEKRHGFTDHSYLNIAEPYSYPGLEVRARKRQTKLAARLFEEIVRAHGYRYLGFRMPVQSAEK